MLCVCVATLLVVCVCVCVFSSHLFWTSSTLDVPAGVTQEEGGHTGFLIHFLSAVRALIFLARRIQPFLSLVGREVEFCDDLIVLHMLGIFIYLFLSFSEKNPVCRDRTHVPTCQKVTRLLLSYRGDLGKTHMGVSAQHDKYLVSIPLSLKPYLGNPL